MPNDIENIKIQKELEKIRLYKSKIKELIQDFVSKEFSANILTDEEKEQAIKLYSSCISFMNKEFYGYSIYNLNSKIKENGIYLPNKDFLNTLNYKHLLYYRSILSKLYEELSSQNILTHNLIYAISMKVGLRGFIYFNEQEHKTPIEDLEDYYSEKYSKDISLKKEKVEENNTIIYNVDDNKKYKLTSENEVVIGSNKVIDRKSILDEIQKIEDEIRNNLEFIPGVQNKYSFYNSLYNVIIKEIYGRDIEEIINTINERKDIPIKVSGIKNIMCCQHLVYLLGALNELNSYILSKKNIVNLDTRKSLYEISYSLGRGINSRIRKDSESNKTPYLELIDELKKKNR